MDKKKISIVISGPANTGKTAIAQHIAWELSNHFGIAATVLYEEGDEAAPTNEVEQILAQLSERIEVEVTTRHTPNRCRDSTIGQALPVDYAEAMQHNSSSRTQMFQPYRPDFETHYQQLAEVEEGVIDTRLCTVQVCLAYLGLHTDTPEALALIQKYDDVRHQRDTPRLDVSKLRSDLLAYLAERGLNITREHDQFLLDTFVHTISACWPGPVSEVVAHPQQLARDRANGGAAAT